MSRTTEMVNSRAIAYAENLGAQHGRNAGEWFSQDAFGGRHTGNSAAAAQAVLDAIANSELDGPTADLSGEWADRLTGPELAVQATDYAGGDGDDANYLFDDLCDAYENAYNQAAQDEIERAARYQLEG